MVSKTKKNDEVKTYKIILSGNEGGELTYQGIPKDTLEMVREKLDIKAHWEFRIPGLSI